MVTITVQNTRVSNPTNDIYDGKAKIVVPSDDLLGFAELIKKKAYDECWAHEAYELFINSIARDAPVAGLTPERAFRRRLPILRAFYSHYGYDLIEPTDCAGIVAAYEWLKGEVHDGIVGELEDGDAMCDGDETVVQTVVEYGVGCTNPDDHMRDVLLTADLVSATAAAHVHRGYFQCDWSSEDPYKFGYCYMAMFTSEARKKLCRIMMDSAHIQLGPLLTENTYVVLKGLVTEHDFVDVVDFATVGNVIHMYPDTGTDRGFNRCDAYTVFVKLKSFFSFVSRQQAYYWSSDHLDFVPCGLVGKLSEPPQAQIVAVNLAPPVGIPLRFDHWASVRLRDLVLTATIAREYSILFTAVRDKTAAMRNANELKTEAFTAGAAAALAALEALSPHLTPKRQINIDDVVRAFVRRAKSIVNLCDNHIGLKAWLATEVRGGRYTSVLAVC